MSIHQLFTQHPGEKVEFSLRRHPIVFVAPTFMFLLLACLPFAARMVLLNNGPILLPNPLADVGLKLLIATYYLGIWVFYFSEFTDYYLDIDIVTNDRVIDVVQKGLFGRSVAELDLTRVQDVHSEIKGIIPTLLNYGKVTIQTAATEELFIFDQVPGPHQVRQRILEIAALDRKREARDIMRTATPEQAAAAENDMQRQGLG